MPGIRDAINGLRLFSRQENISAIIHKLEIFVELDSVANELAFPYVVERIKDKVKETPNQGVNDILEELEKLASLDSDEFSEEYLNSIVMKLKERIKEELSPFVSQNTAVNLANAAQEVIFHLDPLKSKLCVTSSQFIVKPPIFHVSYRDTPILHRDYHRYQFFPQLVLNGSQDDRNEPDNETTSSNPPPPTP